MTNILLSSISAGLLLRDMRIMKDLGGAKVSLVGSNYGMSSHSKINTTGLCVGEMPFGEGAQTVT